MDYDIAIVENNPESIFTALRPQYLSAELFHHPVFDIVGNGYDIGGGFGIADDKVVGNGLSYFLQVKRHDFHSFFFEHGVRNDFYFLIFHQ